MATIIREPTSGFKLIGEQTTIQQSAIEQYRFCDLRSLARVRILLHPADTAVDRNPRLEKNRLVVNSIGKTERLLEIGYPENREILMFLAGCNDVLPRLRYRSTVGCAGGSNFDYGDRFSIYSRGELLVVEEIDHAGLD